MLHFVPCWHDNDLCCKKEKRGDQNVNRSTDNYHFVKISVNLYLAMSN